jgi:hypothetical protein
MDAHIQKERKHTENEKSRYRDKFLVTTALTPPKQHQKSDIFKNDTSEKETVHKRHHRPIMDRSLSREEKSALTKQCLQ